MSEMIWFARRTLGGRSVTKSGLLVSKGESESGDKHISFRLSEDVLSRLRWIEGDLVVAGIARNGNATGTCKMRRVPSPREGGCKLSGHGKQSVKSLVVRFTVDESEFNRVFCDNRSPYAGELLRVEDDGTAVFSVVFG